MPQSIRCKNCNKLLARAAFHYIEVKCPRCKTLNQLTRATEPPTHMRSYNCGEHQPTCHH
ncbi:Com family DNA-binding transcriptional regulator [Escherichia coli]|uniref:Com family DNA-binding transcriptional regulator n=1 Tax=Escherichia coli TaxID=562 RepID=UPI00287A93C7|nr:Com family DNA-binding transcriptional regulator [Escherichia coli]MDS1619950.1 Com family DNA-binding transcriptional regulator [Escherichia coli]